ncbi:MAG: hypothetical protein ACLQPH_00640 [Acidimicrobiales bacterium]
MAGTRRPWWVRWIVLTIICEAIVFWMYKSGVFKPTYQGEESQTQALEIWIALAAVFALLMTGITRAIDFGGGLGLLVLAAASGRPMSDHRCVCGHPRKHHEHDRFGTECAGCRCERYRRRWWWRWWWRKR